MVTFLGDITSLAKKGKICARYAAEIFYRKSAVCVWAYLILVTGTTGAARVKNSVRCKFFQIERKKIHILLFLG